MNHKIYNKKGLTFKGAFVVVIFAHVIGIVSLYGYSKYKSNQLKLAREEWKTKLEQRDVNQRDWKTNNGSCKIVAKSHLTVPTETKPTINTLGLWKKAQDLTAEVLHNAGTEIDSALKDINKKEKVQARTQLIASFIETKTKPKNKANNTPSNPPPAIRPNIWSAPVAVRSVPPPKKTVKSSNSHQSTSVTIRSVPSPRKPVTSYYNPSPTSKQPTRQTNHYQTQQEPRLRTHSDYDYETRETVQTFYSY
jgi:hypothetical protein